MTTLSPVAQRQAQDLDARQRRFNGFRTLSWATGAVAVLAAAASRPLSKEATLPLMAAVLVVGFVSLLATVALRVWLHREARWLNARHAEEGERIKSDLRAGKTPSIAGPDAEPDWRFVTPEGRRKVKIRRWVFFAFGVLMGMLAEYQIRERGNIPIGAIYLVFAGGSLLYWFVLGQRLRDMA